MPRMMSYPASGTETKSTVSLYDPMVTGASGSRADEV